MELLSSVEDQEEPVHDVEDYKHPREGFQKELVNPKMRYFSRVFGRSASKGHVY